jgi:hypothetical protein
MNTPFLKNGNSIHGFPAESDKGFSSKLHVFSGGFPPWQTLCHRFLQLDFRDGKHSNISPPFGVCFLIQEILLVP